jgi:hypothetical protein
MKFILNLFRRCKSVILCPNNEKKQARIAEAGAIANPIIAQLMSGERKLDAALLAARESKGGLSGDVLAATVTSLGGKKASTKAQNAEIVVRLITLKQAIARPLPSLELMTEKLSRLRNPLWGKDVTCRGENGTSFALLHASRICWLWGISS